jgi:thiamine-phosphate pyrophosphorylase
MTVEMPIDAARLRVYVVTSSVFRGRSHRDVALAAVEGGATAVQLRAPELCDHELLPLAAELAVVCRDAGVWFLVNDRLGVAVASGADGAHVGQGDDLHDAREKVGARALLGVSVGDAEQARDAAGLGADYLGVTVWATSTKPEANPRGIEGLAGVAVATSLPVVGIGGIDADAAAQVLAAGAAGIAVISAVAAADDPVSAVRRLRRAVDEQLEEATR